MVFLVENSSNPNKKAKNAVNKGIRFAKTIAFEMPNSLTADAKKIYAREVENIANPRIYRINL